MPKLTKRNERFINKYVETKQKYCLLNIVISKSSNDKSASLNKTHLLAVFVVFETTANVHVQSAQSSLSVEVRAESHRGSAV